MAKPYPQDFWEPWRGLFLQDSLGAKCGMFDVSASCMIMQQATAGRENSAGINRCPGGRESIFRSA